MQTKHIFIKRPGVMLALFIVLFALPLMAIGQERTGTVSATGMGDARPLLVVDQREYRVASSVEIIDTQAPEVPVDFQAITPGAVIRFDSRPGSAGEPSMVTRITILERSRRER